MRTPASLACLSLIVCLLTPDSSSAQPKVADALRQDIDFARRKVYPALVNIAVISQEHSEGRSVRSPAAGSGVIVSPAGHVLTNFHVAGDTVRITCTLPSGEAIPASVVAHDPLTDLSVLKLELKTRKGASGPLPFATLGDSKALAVGDYVLAMGNPLTLSSSLTLGVVSNTRRVFTDFTGTELEEVDLGEGEKTGLFTQWIQHDALILPGNSGGPLVNLRGEVVGINELGGWGLGFAIPSNLAAKVLNQALTHGEVRRGWLGIAVLPVHKLGRRTGALVSFVAPASAAHKGGLKAGDILLALGDHKVDVRFFEQVPVFYQEVAEMPPGTGMRARYLRDGTERECVVQLDRMQKFLGKPAEFKRMGITLRDITGPMALARGFPNQDGVLVTGIRPGYPMQEARPEIKSGDVILQVNGRAISSPSDFETIIMEASGKTELAISYRRRGESLLTVVDIEPEKPPTGGHELPTPWLGVHTQVLTTKVSRALGLKARGFRVTQVLPWTKAADAGLRAGDIITALNDDKLDAYRPQDAEDLRQAIRNLLIGDEVELAVSRATPRGWTKLKLKVMLEEAPESGLDAKKSKHDAFEFSVREINLLDRSRFSWPKDERGVMVTAIESGGWAQIAGLHIDDLIQSIDTTEVTDIKTFEEAMAEIDRKHPKLVRIFVRRGYRTHFVFVEPHWEDRKK